MAARPPASRSTAAATRTNNSCCPGSDASHRLKKASRRFRGCRRRHLDRTSGGLPGTKAAADVRDRPQSHALGRLRRQRRAPAGGAEKHKALVLPELRLVVLARRVDPELQHAARTMERARHAPIARELADIAQVDKLHVVMAVQLDCLGDIEIFDLAFGGPYHVVDANGDVLRHCDLPPNCVAEQVAAPGDVATMLVQMHLIAPTRLEASDLVA